MRGLALALVVVLAQGCAMEKPPEGQLVLHVTSDAPSPLFDRLRVELYAPGETAPCPGCAREFSLEDGSMERDEVSFGFFPRVRTPGYRARVRLFRSGGTASGEPRRGSTIERVVALPTAPGEGLVTATVTLPVEDLARPRGTLDAPVAAEPGAPPRGYAGSLPAAAPRACHGAAGEGEVCVPGGVFWMGNPRLDVLDGRESDGHGERLVAVSPFFLDAKEVTVAELRAARVARVVDDPLEAGQHLTGCLYTADPGPNDELPVNCLSWQRARTYCEKVGKRLPSEVEYEYAAGARVSRSFPWGEDVPACGDAIYRGDEGCFAAGPRPAGRGVRDRIAFGAGEIVDLAGNLREYAQDGYRPGTDPCWGEGLLVDPLCDPDPTAPSVARTVRGGSYGDEGTLLRAAIRTFVEEERFAVSALIGFRCARSAR